MKKIGIFFSGYGNQCIGMGKEFYDQSRVMQELFEEAANCLEINFVKLCFASSDAEIKKMENAYPAIFLYQISLVALLKEQGIVPYKVAGLDIGEYAALYTAGGINLPDALYFLRKFAQSYQAIVDEDKFAQIRIAGIDEETIKKLCQEVTDETDAAMIAVYELPHQMVISGTQKAVSQLAATVKKDYDIKPEKLDVERGLHSMYMDDVVKNIKMYLEKIDFKDTKIPFVSGVIAQPLQEGELFRASIMQHIHAPTQWLKVMHEFSDCDVIIEIGYGNALSSLFNRVYPDKKVYTLAVPADKEVLEKELL